MPSCWTCSCARATASPCSRRCGPAAAGQSVTVIVLTNFAFPHFRDRSLKLGANYFFDKAKEYDRVRDVLEELVARASH